MSTNHTPNYSLSQWQASDQVLRTDFNEDNAKIDAALNLSFRRELIMEVTAQEDTIKLELDISELDWGSYQFVVMKYTPSEAKNVGVKIEISDVFSGATSSDSRNAYTLSLINASMDCPAVSIMFPFRFHGSLIKAISLGYDGYKFLTGGSFRRFEELKVLRVASAAGNEIPLTAGTAVSLWGVN